MKCIAPMKISGTTERWNIFFQESICFTSACGIHGNSFVVHAHQVNPVDYPTASIIGAELRDKEIIISFAKMIYQKIKAQETGTTFPLSEKFICSNENNLHRFLKLLNPKDVPTLTLKRACFWKPFGSERVNEFQKLLKSPEKYFYPTFSSFSGKLS